MLLLFCNRQLFENTVCPKKPQWCDFMQIQNILHVNQHSGNLWPEMGFSEICNVHGRAEKNESRPGRILQASL